MSDDKKKKFEEGTHETKVSSWGLRETNNGNIQAYIRFSNGATYFQMAGVSDDGDKYLAEALTVCGFKGKDLSDLFEDDALDKAAEVKIFIKYKPNKTTGEPEMQVFVNGPEREMKGALDKKDALSKIKELKINLKKELKAAQSEIQLPEKKDVKLDEKPAVPDVDEDEIPF